MVKFIKSYPETVNIDKLISDLRAQFPSIVQRETECEIHEVNVEDEVTIDAIIAAHDPQSLTTIQRETVQAATAKTTLQALMSGLHGLSAEDKSYAIACRIMAQKDGANNQVVIAIVDRATATAYVTSKPEWTGATAATRALVGDVLEMIAGITQMMLVVLQD